MELWEKQILKLDTSVFGSVKLMIDGLTVVFDNQVYRRKIVIAYFVNGVFKGEYTTPESDIGAKFGSPRYIKHDSKMLAFIKKYKTKKEYEAAKVYKKLYAFDSKWTSARSLIKHLKSTCKDISIYEEGT